MEEKKEHEFKVPYPPRSPVKRPATRPIHLGLTASSLASGQQPMSLKRKRESDERLNFSLFAHNKPAAKSAHVDVVPKSSTVGQQHSTESSTGPAKKIIVLQPQSVIKQTGVLPSPLGVRRHTPNKVYSHTAMKDCHEIMNEHSYTGKDSCTSPSPGTVQMFSAKQDPQLPQKSAVSGNGVKVPTRYQSIIKEHGLLPQSTTHKKEGPQMGTRAIIGGKKLQSPQLPQLFYQSLGQQHTAVSGSLYHSTTDEKEDFHLFLKRGGGPCRKIVSK